MKLLEEHIGENPHYLELNKKFSDATIKYDPKRRHWLVGLCQN